MTGGIRVYAGFFLLRAAQKFSDVERGSRCVFGTKIGMLGGVSVSLMPRGKKSDIFGKKCLQFAAQVFSV